MPGRDLEELTTAEGEMYQTIELLLALPEQERKKMEEAVEYKFTMEQPAPKLETTEENNQLLCTLNMGTTAAAEILYQEGLNPVALNFAHAYNCGGGFEHTGGSQEEACFRTSSLFLSLWPHRRADDGPGVLTRGMWIGDFDEALPRKKDFYPHTECGGIYSPFVKLTRRVAKGRNAPLYKAIEVPRLKAFGFITMAAQNVPRDQETSDKDFDPDLLKEKCRTILHLAVAHGHDSIVLGAFGCGYFDNPPEDVAGTFSELLFGEFEGAFRLVAFAIPDKSGDTLDEFTRLFPMKHQKELKDLLFQYKRKVEGEVADRRRSEEMESLNQKHPSQQAGQSHGVRSFEIDKKGGAAAPAGGVGEADRGCCASCSVM